jgi:hypothetical protein
MDLSDKAFNTLNLLRHVSFLDWENTFKVKDSEVEAVCKELVEYFKEWPPKVEEAA